MGKAKDLGVANQAGIRIVWVPRMCCFVAVESPIFSDGEPPRPHLAAPVAGHSTRVRGAGEAAALPGELRRSQPFLRLAARYFGALGAESSESP